MAKLNFELPADVAAMYEVQNTTQPILHSRIGKVDFRVITLQQAKDLIQAGTMYLKEKKQPKSKKAAKDT